MQSAESNFAGPRKNDRTLRLPRRRSDLQCGAAGADGVCTIKTDAGYFRLGPEEHFLLMQLDGVKSPAQVREAFAKKFNEPLDQSDLATFTQLAGSRGLLAPDIGAHVPGATRANTPGAAPSKSPPRNWASLLAWRKPFWDPDRALDWLTPKLSFCFTRTFVIASIFAIVSAVVVLWSNADQLVTQFHNSLGLPVVMLILGMVFTITGLHEVAHGVACKRYGGHVHEIGVLVLCMMPCLYCNVSDSWLVPDKRKRMIVTLAGGYFEMCFWACAVFVWRLTLEDTLISYMAFTVITVSGVRVFLNFNPFLKLDGYYLLSDGLGIPNLRQQALDYLFANVRWLLWGAPRPERPPRSKTLIAYGIACWCFSILMTVIMLHLFGSLLTALIGPLGTGLAVALGLVFVRGLFGGLLKGEAKQMFLVRRKRLVLTIALIAGAGYALTVVPMEKRAHGTFEVRPLARRDVRAPIAGFIREINLEEGQKVSASGLAVRLEIPDLESRMAQKQAEVEESEAQLRLLKQGPRKEEVAEQQQRIARAESMRLLAEQDLARAKEAMRREMIGHDHKVKQIRAEVMQAKSTAFRTKQLLAERLASPESFEIDMKRVEVAQAVLIQALATKAEREAKGTSEAEQMLALREKELADERGALDILAAGSRIEKIEAEEAQLARLAEELNYLRDLQSKLLVQCGWNGVIVTPHIKEKVGQYVNEGDLICTVEEIADLKIEIELPEQELRDVQSGQLVELKARALPYDTFEATVERLAPSAQEGDVQSSVVVHTKLKDPPEMLRPGMTGYARISCGARPVGEILLANALQYIRTEFWW